MALSYLNTGVMTDEDDQLLRSREILQTNEPPRGAVWLFYKRDDVDSYNQEALTMCLIMDLSLSQVTVLKEKESWTNRRAKTHCSQLDC